MELHLKSMSHKFSIARSERGNKTPFVKSKPGCQVIRRFLIYVQLIPKGYKQILPIVNVLIQSITCNYNKVVKKLVRLLWLTARAI